MDHESSNDNFDESDLQQFRTWLRNFSMPCNRCNYVYKLPDHVVESAQLTGDRDMPFKLTTHEIYACVNPQCDSTFSYPDTTFVREFLKSYQKHRS